MKELRNRIYLFILTVISYIFAYLFVHLQLIHVDARLRLYFVSQFYFTLGLCLFFSFLLIFLKKEIAVIEVCILKFIIILIIGIPLGESLVIEFLLLSILIIEIEMYFPIPYHIISSVGMLAILMSFQRTYYVWDIISPSPPSLMLLLYSFLFFLVIIAGYGIRKFIDKIIYLFESNSDLNLTIDKLMKVNKDFQEYALSQQDIGVMEERKRISREIHDTIGYTLTNIIIMMESATDFAKSNPKKTEELLEKAREQAEKGLEEIRYSLRLLRTIDGKKFKGIKSIQKLVDLFSQNTGIKIKIEYGNIPWSFNEEIDTVIYHIIQESLINSLRHGHATIIRINFWLRNGDLIIKISDNGIGSQVIKYGIGFSGIKERLNQLKGDFSVSSDDNGFEVSVSIPIKNMDEIVL